ncbi:uncharacterized protein LOC126893085 [Diabrotica virgifera virgifera]|uniref:Uncharacterized protein n=1 Tax=Diabrotica virgifera virgifera TaxID=50390 RepID=A0ABM5L967_DIAVI|nr:uncharacterized protein LOC126893085 [Diabrotica virgifera virgifera]
MKRVEKIMALVHHSSLRDQAVTENNDDSQSCNNSMTNYAAISTEENNTETQLGTTATEVLIDIDRAPLACSTASVDHIESSKENIVNPQVEKLEATGIIIVDMGTPPAEESSSNCQTDISKDITIM